MPEAHRHAPQGPNKAKADLMGEKDPMCCSARSKQTGQQCKRSPIPGGFVCRYHGGNAPQVKAKAEERLAAHYPRAVQVIGELLERTEFPTVQLGACKFVVEQEDGRATERLEANVTGQIDIVTTLRQRFVRRQELDASAG